MSEADYLRAEARRCRDWARKASGAAEHRDLVDLAAGYEASAERIEARSFQPKTPPARARPQ